MADPLAEAIRDRLEVMSDADYKWPEYVTEEAMTAVRAYVADLERRVAGAEEVWSDGYEAGHTDARAVQATYPDPTPNPYSAALAGEEQP